MAIKKFTKSKAFPISWEGIRAWSYTSKDDLPSGSAIVFEVDGNHGKVMSKISDRIYYVVKGKGKFVTDKKGIEVEKLFCLGLEIID